MGEPRYTVEVRENSRQVSKQRIQDPFVMTSVYVRGWRAALAVLFRRYRIVIHVQGDHEMEERVLELDPDYLGGPGSKSRRAWEVHIEGALRRYAQSWPDDGAGNGD